MHAWMERGAVTITRLSKTRDLLVIRLVDVSTLRKLKALLHKVLFL